MHARADALVDMAVADEAVGRKASVAHAPTVNWSQLPHILCSCTASIAAELCRLAAGTNRGHRQRCREGAVGGRDGEEPGCLVRRASASLQGAPQRRRWALAARMLHRACCALPASFCSQLPRLTLCSVLRYFFVCLLVCLFVWLVATGLCKTPRRWRGLRRTRVVAW